MHNETYRWFDILSSEFYSVEKCEEEIHGQKKHADQNRKLGYQWLVPEKLNK